MLLRIRNLNGDEIFVATFSRTGFVQMRKSATRLSACFNRTLAVASILISTASFGAMLLYCGFGWKPQPTCRRCPFTHTLIRFHARLFTACGHLNSCIHRCLQDIRSFHRHLLLLLYLYRYKYLYS